MLNDERGANYLKQGRVLNDRGEIVGERERTPAQMSRELHKGNSRKTHVHDRDSVPEGQKFRCLRCSPLPWNVSTDIRSAVGPRDWIPKGSR
jgi:hypothetical protein